MKYILSTISLAIVLFLTACGGGETATTQQQVQESPVQQQAVDASVVEVTIEGNDQMQYNLKTIEVKEGQTVKLTLKNVGEMAKDVMGHNWVLLKEGVDKNEFATAAIAAADNDYIPADKAGDVIVHTKTLGGGESDSIEFEAPAAGSYEYICSFPGHVAIMNGTFVVTSAE